MIIPYCFFDAPQVIDTTVTPIPASSGNPLQVIANSGVNLGVGISFIDSTNRYIGVYVGKAGQEVLICVIGSGVSSQGWGKFPPNSRVSLRSMDNIAINGGSVFGVLVTS